MVKFNVSILNGLKIIDFLLMEIMDSDIYSKLHTQINANEKVRR